MCTVTIIPKDDHNFILTSNRDEAPNRISLPPRVIEYHEVSLLYPEDQLSGGTWIGASEHNRTLCLLNGGFKLHTRQATYRQSRGVVVKDLLSAKDIISAVEAYNFSDIEPFTLVIADYNSKLRFYELVWDGTVAHFKQLPLEPHIWSSSTLYTESMKAERIQWFRDYKLSSTINADTLLNFHKTAGAGNIDYGVIMNREVVKTTSITQVEKNKASVVMRYENLQNTQVMHASFNLSKAIHE